MHGFVADIEALSKANVTFRTVLYTARNCQLVIMALKVGEDIGMDVHKLDQFFRIEQGSGEACRRRSHYSAELFSTEPENALSKQLPSLSARP